MVDKDRVKGAVKDVAGQAQEEVGKLTGHERTTREGRETKAEGKIDKAAGHVKDAVRGGTR